MTYVDSALALTLEDDHIPICTVPEAKSLVIVVPPFHWYSQWSEYSPKASHAHNAPGLRNSDAVHRADRAQIAGWLSERIRFCESRRLSGRPEVSHDDI